MAPALSIGIKRRLNSGMVQLSFPLQALPMDSLPKESLPLTFDAVGAGGSVYGYELETLRRVVLEFEKTPDDLLMKLLNYFYPEMIFEIPVIATSGGVQRKNIWTSQLNGKSAIFFNLGGWRVDSLTRFAAKALLQEAVVALFLPLLRKGDAQNALAELELMILAYGLGAFLAAPVPRQSLITEHAEKWKAAEAEILRTKLNMLHPDYFSEDKEEILEFGITGDFWQQSISVAGMFRVAQVFQHQGLEGLIKIIDERSLPAPQP